MATLQAIGFTAAGGAAVCGLTFIFFGVAVRSRSDNVAPRATARSRDVIYNPKARRGKGSSICFRKSRNEDKNHPKKNEDSIRSNVPIADVEIGSGDRASDERTREEVQFRGGPVFGWIPWTLSFSYDQLLKGIPGTGTRKNGMEGSMLKVNLDGIILLRFHGKVEKHA